MGYYVGDIPAGQLVIEPARIGPEGEEPIDLDPFIDYSDASGLYGPDGSQVVEADDILIDAEAGTVTVVYPWDSDYPSHDTNPFAVPGIYTVRVILIGDHSVPTLTLPPTRLVVDAIDDGWHTLDSARDDWRDAPGYDAWLYELLWTAKHDVLAYAPALADGAPVPLNYRRAQLMQARNLWNAGKVDPATGTEGDDTFVLRPYPLDWVIKQILRPKTARPVIA